MIVNVFRDLIENALLIEDQSEQKDAFDSLIEELVSSYFDFDDKPEFYYLIGYCWYCHPKESLERAQAIESNFKKSIELCSNKFYPRLYLAHHFFDVGRYSEALELFESLDTSFLKDFDQQWRVLKIFELKICCEIGIEHQVPIKRIKNLVTQYESLDEPDTAIPSELIRCLSSYFTNQEINEPEKKIIQRLLNLISKLDINELFLDEILILESKVRT